MPERLLVESDIGTNVASTGQLAIETGERIQGDADLQLNIDAKANLAGGNTFTGVQVLTDGLTVSSPINIDDGPQGLVTILGGSHDGDIAVTMPDSGGTLLARDGDGSSLTGITAGQVANTPAGGIAATTVQAAINELDGEKVSGPSSATSTAIALFDGTGGKLVKNSAATIDANGLLRVVGMGQHLIGESDQNNGIKVTRTGGFADSYFSFFAAAFEPAIDCSARLRFTFNQGSEVASMTTAGVFTAAGFTGPLTGNVTGNVSIPSGANLKAGTFTLTAGAATVGNTSVTANSVILVTLKTLGGTRVGNPDIVPTASTGFVATGAGTDTSTYNYVILEVN